MRTPRPAAKSAPAPKTQPPRLRGSPEPWHCGGHRSAAAHRGTARGCTASPRSPRFAVHARPRSP
eukprot:3674398-Alexandrium_andersonii.AAC.1